MSTLYVLAGLSGTGKTTAAEILADKVNGEIHKTDSIRKQIISGEPEYTRAESQRVYDALFSRAEADLENGRNVVLDATFSIKKGRRRAENIASKTNSDIQFLLVTCDDSIVRKRLRNRSGSDSDADVEVYEMQKESFESFTRSHTVIDNSGSISSLRSEIHRLV